MSFLLGLFFLGQVHAQTVSPLKPQLQLLGFSNYTFEVKSPNAQSKHTFIFENTGLEPISQIQIIPVAVPFVIKDLTDPTMTTCDSVLPAGGRCTVTVTFAPIDNNSASTLLVLTYFDGDSTQTAFANMLGNVDGPAKR